MYRAIRANPYVNFYMQVVKEKKKGRGEKVYLKFPKKYRAIRANPYVNFLHASCKREKKSKGDKDAFNSLRFEICF